MESRLLLDVVVRKSAAILELFAGEDQPLLVGGDTLFVWQRGCQSRALGAASIEKLLALDLRFDIVDLRRVCEFELVQLYDV